jgi:D-alanyl-D-alanine carboxypeptidase
MNLWATHFGMKNTFYCNPHGLANRLNRSTASDQAILVQKVL